jgi:two-component sensor histidine kinase
MLASWPLPAESAETVLLRPEGDEALVLNSLRHRQDAALKLSLPLARAGSPEASAARGRQGVVQGPDYRGVEVLAMRRRVPGSPWCIVSKLDAQEAFAAMRARSALVLLMTGGFALLGAATAALVWQRSAKVHYRALFEAEEEAAARARQQAVIADLGQLAVRGTSLPELLAEATRCVGQALGAETCEILELLPGQAELALRAGVGWPDGLAGPAAVAAGNESLAGYVVQTKVPVVAHDLRTDPRFRTPQPLLDRGVASGLGTLIGDPGRPHGVLSAHAVRPREFTQRDVHFLQAAAKLLGDAIEHHLSAAAVRQRAEELARLNLELTESRRATLGLIEDATAARRRAEEANAALRHEVEERRRTADALRVSLEEKLVLLKEVHHRVKNNLQIVASLLTLQAARTCGQTQAAAVLHDTCNRVHAMALLHEILYRSPNLARLSFQTYVRELCGHLLRSHGRAETATIQHRVLRVGLPIEQAVPCGLIISELVANALKHGLAEGGTGSVTVEFQQAAEGQFVLRVSDDGAGLPPDLDVAALATLGLHLVASLAGQLGGRLVIERPAAGGAALAVFFPVPHGTFIESGT